MTIKHKTRQTAMRGAPQQVLIFDMDGTLIDTDAANSAAYRCALAKFCGRGKIKDGGRITAADIRKSFKAEACDVILEKAELYAGHWRPL